MANDTLGNEIIRRRGDTAPDVINVLDQETGQALDITGFSYTMTLNTEKDPEAGIGTEIASVSGTITDAANGRVEFLFSAGNADQAPGCYFYDIQQTDASGRIKTIAKNKYRFYQDVTK